MIRIGLLVYPGAQIAAVEGLCDLFTTANGLHSRKDVNAIPLALTRWAPTDATTVPLSPPQPLTVLIVPPSLEKRPSNDQACALGQWVADRHAEGTFICSICAGAFLVAEAGLLNGRPATTHWALAEEFANQFPEVDLNADKLLIEDGDIITAGGVMAWVDLGLKLVARFWGPATMIETARFFLVDPSAREQRYYSGFVPRMNHGDSNILGVQHWVQANSAERVTVPILAKVAKMGERTFLRRFVKATGLKPSEYVQRVRVGKARELLELTGTPIDRIAWSVGYEDPSAFRKVFHKVVGLSPGAYRRRFSVERESIE